MVHIPVLLKEVLEVLEPKGGEFVIDGTTDGGGHLEAIIAKMKKGKVLAVEWDIDILDKTRKRIETDPKIKGLKLQIIWVNDSYTNIPEILNRENLPKADALLLDLGFSTEQLESLRGFSYANKDADEPLDMRYARYDGDGNARATASDVVNSLRESELADIIYKYGEERFSRRIAKRIVEARGNRRIITVKDLVEVIKSAVPGFFRKGERDVIARVFQALRIYVNQELENVESILKNSMSIMNKGGRIAIISFHSLEDRLVKNYFRQIEKEDKVKILTKKPITPTKEEITINNASRSAKLRAIKIN